MGDRLSSHAIHETAYVLRVTHLVRPRPRRRGVRPVAALSLALLALPGDGVPPRAEIHSPAGLFLDLDELVLREDYVGAFARAARSFETRVNERGFRDAFTLRALHDVALVAHLGGDQHTAEELAQLSLELHERYLGANDTRTVESLVLRGLVAKYANDVVLAQRCYTQALGRLEPSPENGPLIADALVGRANVVRVDHARPADIVSILSQAREVRESAGERAGLGLADNLVWLGWSLLHGGDHAQAERLLEQAEAVLRESGLAAHSLMGTALTARADLHFVRGDTEEAERSYRAGLDILERSREGYLPGFSRRRLSLRGYDDLAALELRRGRDERAWQSLERLRDGVSLDLATLAAWHRLEPDGYRRAQYLRERLHALELAAGARSGLAARLHGLPERLVTLASLYELERDFLARHTPGPVTSEALRAQLPPRTAYIGWLHSATANRLSASGGALLESAWMYVVRADAPLRWIPLWTARERAEASRRASDLETCHGRLHAASDWPLRVARDAELERGLHAVWRDWLGGAAEYLEGVDRLIVEYSREFPRVPLEGLIDDVGRFVGERFACSYVPSAATFLSLGAGAAPEALARRPALALGGATFGPSAAAASGEGEGEGPASSVIDQVLLRLALDGDPAALDRLPVLPHSLEEARAVAALFPGSRLLAGADATERKLDELARSGRLADYGLLHLATHMLVDCHPERSALALSRLGLGAGSAGDGLLRAREVLESWQLDSELLVLSGCQSARSCSWDEGEYIGFTQALTAVGARSVVASMWKVDDRATALLMQRFHENLAGRRLDGTMRGRPLARDAALAEAKRWLRELENDDGERPFAHPVYWAGFVLFGPAG